MRVPDSLLARTFWLLALLVTLTTIAWLSLFRLLDAEPRARETAQLATSAVNLIRAAIFAAAPERRLALFAELSSREGIRLLPAEAQDRVKLPPEDRFFTLVQEALSQQLGPRTRMALAVDGVPGFWVSFRLAEDDEEEYWLILPAERIARGMARQWLLWAAVAFALALLVAALMASRLSRPLKSMARSAAALGRGERPEPLPEDGPAELREVATAFNRMAEDLRQIEQDRAEVLAGISHDVRTPLARLRLEIELSMADESAREAAVADIEQMETVLAQFMDYARGDQGELPQPTDVVGLLQGIADQETARGRPLTTDIRDLPLQTVRPRALRRAVLNLIDNARKYGAGEVALTAGSDDHQLEIRIEDDGPGLPEDQIERLKRPFTRLEHARSNASGTGLGLAIVQRVARLHGGSLHLENRPAGGLCARLCLPLNP